MAEGAINLIADHFSAAPGARQRGDVRAGWEEGEVTAEGLKDVKADGSAWLVPRAAGRTLCHGGVGITKGMWISGHATKALSGNVSGTGIVLVPCQAGRDGHCWSSR